MNRQEFMDQFILALYAEDRKNPNSVISAKELAKLYSLPSDPDYLDNQIYSTLHGFGWVDYQNTVSPPMEEPLVITLSGKMRAESLLASGSELKPKPGQVEWLESYSKLASASDRYVTFSDNYIKEEVIHHIDKSLEAIQSSNIASTEEKTIVAAHLSAGVGLIRSTSTVAIGAVRYLVIDRLKGAFESSIEDALKVVILSAFQFILATMLGLI